MSNVPKGRGTFDYKQNDFQVSIWQLLISSIPYEIVWI